MDTLHYARVVFTSAHLNKYTICELEMHSRDSDDVFQDVIPCTPVSVYSHFKENFLLILSSSLSLLADVAFRHSNFTSYTSAPSSWPSL